MKLRTLFVLQFLYAAMALAYLAVSYMQIWSGGPALSKAPLGPAAALFLLYAACLLFFGVYYKPTSYRIAMAIAVPALALGGVLMNILS